MKKYRIVVLMLMFAISFAQMGFSQSIVLEAKSGGVYEDGEFTSSGVKYKAFFVIDRERNKVILNKIIKSDREGRLDEDVIYDITSASIGEGISALTISRDKKGQEIITAVREGDLGSSEIYIIGRDFYQYCKGANAKFYLEYGSVIEKE